MLAQLDLEHEIERKELEDLTDGKFDGITPLPKRGDVDTHASRGVPKARAISDTSLAVTRSRVFSQYTAMTFQHLPSRSPPAAMSSPSTLTPSGSETEDHSQTRVPRKKTLQRYARAPYYDADSDSEDELPVWNKGIISPTDGQLIRPLGGPSENPSASAVEGRDGDHRA
ncbi:hypothetical protein K488DRAFT_89069 [Vararia minispora EC-137]|uniref:Uncharacterized protein n=1 Tax=Vararia minispora EC-137 TaxID=1314806 RepID=A0ACB8QBD9_9AGAM|nr:hypothetical protein K488DRAFT_89069 [Vararia minispora EC-137]